MDIDTKEEVLRLPPANVQVLTFSPDGKTLATGVDTGGILFWNLEEEKRKPTPDPKEFVKKPPVKDKLLSGLHSDYEELLQKENNPEPIKRAALLFHQGNYVDALAMLRQHRAKAGVPLLLRYLVEESRYPNGHTDPFVNSFVILTGQTFPGARPGQRTPAKEIGDLVNKLVENWWQPNKARLSLDLGNMSAEQWQNIADQLLVRRFPVAPSSSTLLYPVFDRREDSLEPEPEDRQTWWVQDLHSAMIPALLASTGYTEKPKGAERKDGNVEFRAVRLLASLRKNRQGAVLDKIADDPQQNSATRLTCYLAIALAGEKLRTDAVVSLLAKETNLEHRIAGIQTLEYSQPAKALPPLLRYLDDPHKDVRAAALETLGVLKPPQALSRLQKMLDRARPTTDDSDVAGVVGKTIAISRIFSRASRKIRSSLVSWEAIGRV